MNYFIDTEFIEGTQKKKFVGFNIRETKPTIDLISIGLVCENGKEYYAISKDFNLYEAWNRVQITTHSTEKPNYWIRENVLLPIYIQHINGDMRNVLDFSYNTMKWLIKSIGKSNETIANEICEFILDVHNLKLAQKYHINDKSKIPVFYGYYSAYDWVVFCQLHGIMMNLPKDYPYYCKDLKQMLDEKEKSLSDENDKIQQKESPYIALHNSIKDFGTYPKKENEHHALADARWNKELYNFINSY